jgi:RHS repeat-associated protein
VTNTSAGVVSRHDYKPFGEEIGAGVGGRTVGMGFAVADGLRQQFTSKERDIETGLDYFGARYYSSIQARFTSPDEPLVGQDASDPQTWNLYSYTSNSPLNRIDEDGQRWFYKCGGQGCDVQWVNPNEDGSYTSPGEGYKEFIPTKQRPNMVLYSPDGYKSYSFGEREDGSPRVVWRWTGKIENRPEHIIMAVSIFQDVYAIFRGAVSSFAAWRAARAAEEAARSAAERLPNLAGKTRTDARQALKDVGFENKGTTPGGYEKWYHPDGSRVQIRPDGEVVRSAPKTSPAGGGAKYRPRIGPDGKPTTSHNTGEKVSGR